MKPSPVTTLLPPTPSCHAVCQKPVLPEASPSTQRLLLKTTFLYNRFLTEAASLLLDENKNYESIHYSFLCFFSSSSRYYSDLCTRLLYSNSYVQFVHCYKRLPYHVLASRRKSLARKKKKTSVMGEGRTWKSNYIMLEHNYARTSSTVRPTTAGTPPIALLSASRKDYTETKPKSLLASPIPKPHRIPRSVLRQKCVITYMGDSVANSMKDDQLFDVLL